jgi:uncharacterized protein
METRISSAPHEPNGAHAPMTPQAAQQPPWGYVMTVIWTVMTFLVGSVAALVYGLAVYGADPLSELITKLDDVNVRYDGVFTSHVYLASSVVQFAFFVVLIQYRRWSVTDYLALNLPKVRTIVVYAVALIALLLAVEGVTRLLGHGPTTEFQIVSYRTAKAAGQLPLLFFVIVLVAPFIEEVVFRGFLYRGFVRRPGHEPYAIVIISILFMAAHPQYDWVPLLSVFVLALFLGWARWTTNSTGLTVLLHMLTNFIATTATVIYVEWGT